MYIPPVYQSGHDLSADSPLSAKGLTIRTLLKQRPPFYMAPTIILTLQPSPTFFVPPTSDPVVLAKIYGHVFEREDVDEMTLLLRQEIIKLETLCEKNQIALPIFAKIRASVTNLLQVYKEDYPFVVAEIGIIYFYVEKSGGLPCQSEFLKFRLKEIECEIHYLREKQIAHLPCGIPSYLLRAFSTMLIDTGCRVNKGGAVAVLRLLNSRIAAYFNDDHLKQMQTVIEQIIKDSVLVRTLENPVQIHPYMEVYLRIDLKLPAKSMLSPQHIHMAYVLALLTDLRQSKNPNCYAVATLIQAILVCPTNILLKFQSILQTGCVMVDDTHKLPIYQIFTERLMRNFFIADALQLEEQNQNSILIRSALDAIGVSPMVIQPFLKCPATIKQILSQASQFTLHPFQSFIVASSVAGSFTTNTLQELFLMTSELFAYNSASAPSLSIKDLVTCRNRIIVKKTFLELLKTHFFDVFQGKNYFESDKNFKKFESMCQSKFNEMFWLENVIGLCKRGANQGEMVFEIGSEIYIFPGFFDRVDAPVNMHQFILRLLVVQNDSLLLINNIPALVQILTLTINQIIAEHFTLISEGKPVYQLNYAILNSIYASLLTLPKRLIEFMAAVNDGAICLKEEHYKSSQILIFQSAGANIFETSLKLTGLPCSEAVSFTELTAVDNFFKFFELLHEKFQQSNLAWHTNQLVCSSFNHAFLLQPYKFKSLWEQNPHTAIYTFSEQPMEQLLTKNVLSQEQILSIFVSILENMDSAKEHASLFGLRPSALEFVKQARDLFSDSFYFQLLIAVERELTNIKPASVPYDELLNELPLNLSVSKKRQIATQMLSLLQNSLPLQPFQIALHLQKVLASYGKICTQVCLEHALSKIYQLPLAWTLADLNWGDNKESPNHKFLVLKSSPDGLILVTRNGMIEEQPAPTLIVGLRRLDVALP